MADQVPPQPQPLIVGGPGAASVTVAQVTGPDGQEYVVFQATGPQGIHATWLAGSHAVQLGEHMVKLGRAAAAGLKLADGNGGHPG